MPASQPDCLLLDDFAEHSGARNMAADAELLDATLVDGRSRVRLYRWSRPTLSLGYFQDPAEFDGVPRLAGLDRVRRLSGGGAIVHHHEWTYAVAIPPAHRLADPATRLYDAVHESIRGVLTDCGLVTSLRGIVETYKLSEPALCFARSAAVDLVCGGFKVLGSAQRRRRGAVLQHGSLLMHASPFAPDFPGLAELTCPPRAIRDAWLGQALGQAIAATLGPAPSLAPLPDPLTRTNDNPARVAVDLPDMGCRKNLSSRRLTG